MPYQYTALDPPPVTYTVGSFVVAGACAAGATLDSDDATGALLLAAGADAAGAAGAALTVFVAVPSA